MTLKIGARSRRRTPRWRGEIRRIIERRIDELPVAFRTVFVMREVEDMTVQETAAVPRYSRRDGPHAPLPRARAAARIARARHGQRTRRRLRASPARAAIASSPPCSPGSASSSTAAERRLPLLHRIGDESFHPRRVHERLPCCFVSALLLSAAGASAQNSSTITDAQIASIVVTANQVDIDAGKLAASTSTNAEVKKFAQLMVTDHTGVNKQAVALVTTPEGHAAGQRHQQAA